MGVDIKFSQSYLWLDSWILANILQLENRSEKKRGIADTESDLSEMWQAYVQEDAEEGQDAKVGNSGDAAAIRNAMASCQSNSERPRDNTRYHEISRGVSRKLEITRGNSRSLEKTRENTRK